LSSLTFQQSCLGKEFERLGEIKGKKPDESSDVREVRLQNREVSFKRNKRKRRAGTQFG
jgi:hypothetical protein